MFREMRRFKRAISDEDAKELLRKNRRAAFAVNGDDGYPYAVPVNFYYAEDENRIYFHSAKVGHKIESIRNNDKVCFTTWNDGERIEGDWAYRVSSCVVFGRAVLIEDRALTEEKVRAFAMKYYPTAEEAEKEIRASIDKVQLVAIEIEHISGKRVTEK